MLAPVTGHRLGDRLPGQSPLQQQQGMGRRDLDLDKLAPCGRTVLVDLVPDSPPMRTGHDGQRIGDERLGLTSAVLPAWAVSWALTTPHHLCLLAGYVVAGHNVPA